MPRSFSPFHGKKPGGHRSGPPRGDRPVERTSGPSHMAGDPPIEIAGLELGTDFPFDAAVAGRLLTREVNPKEAFTAVDAAGTFFRVSVKELTPAGGLAVPYEVCAISPEPTVAITLACAVLSRQRMLFVAQKATELGVTSLVPLLTEYSVKAGDLAHEKAHGWPGQVLRAAKQCRRGSLPEVTRPMTFDEFLASPYVTADLALCLDNVGGQTPAPATSPESVLLLVVPEGGFSDGERKKLEGKAMGWELGGRVLRAETAVLVGLAAVHLNWGDYR